MSLALRQTCHSVNDVVLFLYRRAEHQSVTNSGLHPLMKWFDDSELSLCLLYRLRTIVALLPANLVPVRGCKGRAG
jgi:hypothetical protein